MQRLATRNSTSFTHHPKILEVAALPGHQLLVTFDDGHSRQYDFTRHLDLDMFHLLRSEPFFRAVRVDAGGYGLSWNDDMDIAASELWLNGTPAGHKSPVSSPC
jgi:hypothetical protein